MYKFHHSQRPSDLLIQTFSKETFKLIPMRHVLDFHIDSTKTKLAENTIKTQGDLYSGTVLASLQKTAPPFHLSKQILNDFLLVVIILINAVVNGKLELTLLKGRQRFDTVSTSNLMV